MKELKIICVGKVRESFFEEGIENALARIRKKYPLTIRECQDEPTPDGASVAQERIIKEKEGQRILAGIRPEDYLVALCIEGKSYDKATWHEHLNQLMGRMSESGGSLVFVIGGSLGLSQDVIKRADEKLSFSAMTFPHQLMRVILLEQLAAWVG